MLDIGDAVPNFVLPNQYGQPVRLRDFRGFKVVLFSFPRAGMPHCTQQACAYRDVYKEFQRAGAVVMGISSNSTDKLAAWREEHNFPYELLSDPDHDVLDQLGGWGFNVVGPLDLPAPKRAYWVIDETGVLIEKQIGVQPKQSVQQSLDFIQHNADNRGQLST